MLCFLSRAFLVGSPCKNARFATFRWWNPGDEKIKIRWLWQKCSLVLTHQGLSCLVAVRQWSRVDISSRNRHLNKPQKPPRCTVTFKLPHSELSAAKRGCVSSWLLLDTEEYIFPASSSKVRGFRRSYSHGIEKIIKNSCGSFKVHTKTVSWNSPNYPTS